MKLVSLAEKQYDYITVTHVYESRISIDGRRRVHWLCNCKCGNQLWIISSNINRQKVKSCGCLRQDKKVNRFGLATQNKLYSNYRSRAKRKNIEFSISKKDFLMLTKEVCYYCGKHPSSVLKSDCNNGDLVYNGIDRLKNSLGYILDNCVSCCSRCNIAKNKLSESEFLLMIKEIYMNRIKNESS